MDAVGFGVFAIGLFLIYAAVKGVHPLTALHQTVSTGKISSGTATSAQP